MKQLLAILLTIAVAITPLATAEDRTINIPDSEPYGPFTYRDQTGTRAYQYSFNNNVFNVSENESHYFTDNSSIWGGIITAQIIEEGSISSTNEYLITIKWNTTWELVYHTQYIRQAFGRWERIHSMTLYDGDTVRAECNIGERFPVFLGGTSPPPNPTLRWELKLHGAFASNPSLYISVGDDNLGDRTCSPIARNGDPIAFSVGGGFQLPINMLSSAPSVTMITFDSELYDDKLSHHFRTRPQEESDRLSFLENKTTCKQTFIFFGFCDIAKGIEWALVTTFGFVKYGFKMLLSIVPYGDQIYDFITVPLTVAGEFITILFSIFLITDESNGIGMGEVWWAHVVYFLCFGLAVTAFTGNVAHTFNFPFFFVVGSAKALFHTVKFMFITLPMWAYERITHLFRG